MPNRKKYYNQAPKKGGRLAPIAAFLLLVGLLLFIWQVGFCDANGDNWGKVEVEHSPKLAALAKNSGYSETNAAEALLSSDKAAISRYTEYRQELLAAAAEIKVAIYSTHSSESYTAYSGEPKVYGKLGGVYKASAALGEALTAAGIGAVVDETLHDWPDWNKSYANSLVTAKRLLAEYPNLQILIDMHRDAGVSRSNSYTTINGKSAAKIMLVCGSDKRYDHPNWQKNKAFMEKIAQKTEEMYPGLLRRVSVQTGRYNQQVFDRAILVEMGTTENTIEEVEYSAKLLADVLSVVLEEE